MRGRAFYGNVVLHRLAESGIHWPHVLPRHANVHIGIIFILRKRLRRNRFGVRIHRLFRRFCTH